MQLQKKEMQLLKNEIILILIFLMVFQLLMLNITPAKIIYDNRLNYEILKNNANNMEAVLLEVKKDIKRQKLDEYYIILGDSVGYSSPCDSDASIAAQLNSIARSEGREVKFYNLSMPSMQSGDIYVMYKLLKKHEISTDNLIINTIYAGFIKGVPYSTPVFWMKQYLNEVDPLVYEKVYTEFYPKKASSFAELKEAVKHKIYTTIPAFIYRDYIMNKQFVNEYLGNGISNMLHIENNASADVQPWYEKDFLRDLMKNEDYLYLYTDREFTMDESNPQIFFFNKLIEEQAGKNTIFFLAAMNDELLAEGVEKQGYKDNIKRIDEYFSLKPVSYINYNKKIDYDLFSDHIHLIEEGYNYLARDLWSNINTIEKTGGK